MLIDPIQCKEIQTLGEYRNFFVPQAGGRALASFILETIEKITQEEITGVSSRGSRHVEETVIP